MIDGGDISSAQFTAEMLECAGDWFKDQRCVCHQLNNVVKKVLSLEEIENSILIPWRTFIKRIRQSNPFSEMWDKSCFEILGKTVQLQKDTPTRWSSTVRMMEKALLVMKVVPEMTHRCRDLLEHQVCPSVKRFCFPTDSSRNASPNGKRSGKL